MNKDQIRIAIAELRGWKEICEYNGRLMGVKGAAASHRHIPNYPEDLNAIRDAALSLPSHLWSPYTSELRKIISRDCNAEAHYLPDTDIIADIWFYEATALQRAEAYLRVHNRWPELSKEKGTE